MGTGTSAVGQKNQNDGATGPIKKFDDIFSRVDTMHQRDGQKDRQTDGLSPGDSKDLSYTQRRAVKMYR